MIGRIDLLLIIGFKIIQKPDGTKEKIPVLSFTAELDYLDEVMREILTKLKSPVGVTETELDVVNGNVF